MRRLLELALVAAVAWVLLSRCNARLVGEEAPSLVGGAWIAAAGVTLPAESDRGWRLFAFFNPG